ncbi:TIGR04104 family putative zinc finger protein [Planococcus sp. A6]|uniref:TIGR04104 family putative zinc finger protein n=1 Tax=Planococcus sp. A6 TaxID=2992760 RepID=UPI0038B5435B
MNFMARCQNCGFQWGWKDMFKLSLKGKQECRSCHTVQYASGKSNFWSSMLFFIPFILVFNYLLIYMEVGWPLLILFFIVYVSIAYLLIPFFLKLSNTKRRF